MAFTLEELSAAYDEQDDSEKFSIDELSAAYDQQEEEFKPGSDNHFIDDLEGVLARGIYGAPAAIMRSAGGLQQAAGEELPDWFRENVKRNTGGYFDLDPQIGRNARTLADHYVQQIQEEYPLEEGSYASGFGHAVEGITKYAPAAFGGIPGISAAITADVAGSRYPEISGKKDKRDRTISPGQAAATALTEGGLNSLVSLPLVGGLYKQTPFLKRLALTQLETRIQKVGADTISYLSDLGLFGDSDKIEEDNVVDYLQNVVTSKEMTAMGAAFSAVGAGANKKKSPAQVAQDLPNVGEIVTPEPLGLPAPSMEMGMDPSTASYPQAPKRLMPPGVIEVPPYEAPPPAPEPSFPGAPVPGVKGSLPTETLLNPPARPVDPIEQAAMEASFGDVNPNDPNVITGNAPETAGPRTPEEQAAAERTLMEVEQGIKSKGPEIIKPAVETTPKEVIKFNPEGEAFPKTVNEQVFAEKVKPKAEPVPEVKLPEVKAPVVEPKTLPDALPEAIPQPQTSEQQRSNQELILSQHGITDPIYEIPSDITVARPDLMQYKASDSEEGTNATDRIPEDEAVSRFKLGVSLYWRPVDRAAHGMTGKQELIVANGHHRREKVIESGGGIIPGIILNESDGWTAEDVKWLAAEINIADGKGTIYDAVKLVEGYKAKYGEEAALKKVATMGAKGQKAATIGLGATPELLGMFHAQKMSPEHAVAIASGAPGIPEIQQIGITEFLKDPSIDPFVLNSIVNDPKLLDMRTAGTIDMFGNNDGAMRETRERAEVAKMLMREDLDRVRLVKGNVKLESIAKEEGFTNDKPTEELKGRGRELDRLARRWKKWRQFPELVARVDDFIARSTPEMLKNQRGSIITPFKGFNLAQRAREAISNTIDAPEKISAELERMAAEMGGKIKAQPHDPSESYYEGRMGGKYIPGLSTLMKARRTFISRPISWQRRFPETQEVWNAQKELWRDREAVMFDTYEKAKPFYDLPEASQEKVGQAWMDARLTSAKLAKNGQKYVVTPESLTKAGFSEPEIAGYFAGDAAVKDTWNLMEQELINAAETKFDNPKAKENYINEVRQAFQEKRDMNYMPIHRFGEFSVYAEKPGQQPEYYLRENKSDRDRVAQNLLQRGFRPEEIKVGKLLPVSTEAHLGLPRDISLDLAKLTGDKKVNDDMKLPLRGFKGHLVPAELVPGWEKDVGRSLAEYIQGAAGFIANQRHMPAVRAGLEKVDSVRRPQLYDEVSKWVDYVNSNAAEGQKLRSFFTHYYLGFMKPSSAIINMTQPLTTIYPQLGRYTSKPGLYVAEAWKQALEYQANPEKFAAKYPETAQMIQLLKRRGVIAKSATKALTGERRGVPQQDMSISDMSMLFFSTAEQHNHLTATIAAFNAASNPKNKIVSSKVVDAKTGKLILDFAERVKFAEKFDDEANFLYSKMNRPRIGRGKLAPFYTFQGFRLNYLGLLKDFAGEKNYAGIMRMMLPMLALGGAYSIPGVKDAVNAATTAGYDPKKAERDLFGNSELTDMMRYGIPFHFGFNASGALSMGDISPDFEQGIGPAILNKMSGVVGGTFQRGARAYNNYKERGFSSPQAMMRVIEPILPEQLRNAAVAYRGWKEGNITNPSGEVTIPNPTLGELATKLLGFTPSRWTKIYEEQNSQYLTEKASDAYSEGYTRKIANAAVNDKARARELIMDATRKGLPLDFSALFERILTNASPDYRAMKSVPKRDRPKMAETMQTYRK